MYQSSSGADSAPPGRGSTAELGLRVGYAAIIAASVFLLLNTLSYKARDGAYPQALLGLIIVLAAWSLYRSLTGRAPGRSADSPTGGGSSDELIAAATAASDGEERPGVARAGARTVAYLVLTVVYAFAWNWIGTLLATLVFVTVVTPLLGERRVWLMIGLPVVLTALIYCLFRLVLYLPFPSGPLPL